MAWAIGVRRRVYRPETWVTGVREHRLHFFIGKRQMSFEKDDQKNRIIQRIFRVSENRTQKRVILRGKNTCYPCLRTCVTHVPVCTRVAALQN